MSRPIKGTLCHTFEYDAIGKDDPGYIELQVHFTFYPGTPETGRYSGPPENYDPGSAHEVEYEWAEREVERGGKKVFERLKTGEWLDEHCQAWLASRDEDDLTQGLPCLDPDAQRDDRDERRAMAREMPDNWGDDCD